MPSIKTAIEWTDKTWNPTTGCNKISSGCANCYAEAMTKRFPSAFPEGFKVTLHPNRLLEPKKWRKPSRIFVNSMSDLFHEEIPLHFILKVFQVMRETPHHVYQILTKRPERLVALAPQLRWSKNVWLGVSVENQGTVRRVDYLKQVDAQVRFLSCEPLLSDLTLNLDGIGWVIVGGESGNNHRSIEESWVEHILKQCQENKVPFFFKQWGGRTPKTGGRLLNGVTWDEMPIEWANHLNHAQKVLL